MPRILVVSAAPNGIVLVADEGPGPELLPYRPPVRLRRRRGHRCPTSSCHAKGIRGRLPLAPVTGRAEILDKVHVGRPSAAPTAATASPARRRWACWRAIECDDLTGKARRVGEIMLPRLRALAERNR
ncbi:hypothetical protein [Streptosporangium vulgare]|uniref:hypothetical protein n=1 Tax=Streptosporangium vulgare TaxID=46190 RepID=UPI0031DD088D